MAQSVPAFLRALLVRSPRSARLVAVGAVGLLGLLLAPAALASTCTEGGCGFDTCRIGVAGVTPALWGDLEPTEMGPFPAGKNVADGRDASGFDEFKDNYSTRNWYMRAQASGGYIFQGLAHGLSIWQPKSSGGPHFVSKMSFSAFPHQAVGENGKWPVLGIAVPPGKTNVAVLPGSGGMGVSIADLTDKSSPKIIYQEAFIDAQDAHAAVINGRSYGMATTTQGLRIYDLDQALESCKTSCSGVLAGTISMPIASIGGTGRYLAVGRTPSAFTGFTIYDINNPAAPVKKFEMASNDVSQDVEMWTAGAKTYLAVRTSAKLDIYDASCLSGTCGSLPKVGSVGGLFNYGSQYLTLSQDGGHTYLYSGTDNRCGWNSARQPVQQMEYLFDVTNPSSPFDLTPQARLINGASVGYWGWYYRSNPNGANFIAPRSGVVINGQLHRSSMALYDVHKLSGGQPPAASFSHPASIYAGTAATFSDTSTGTVDSRSWSFQDATATSTTAASPSVTFSSHGNKQVSLTVSNTVGQNTATKTVSVLDPVPNVSSITVSPAAPVQCQPVTLTANATGKPTLSYAWQVQDAAPATVANGSGSSYLWQTNGDNAPGNYTAQVQVSNTSGSDTEQKSFTLGQLATLPASGAFAPTNDAFFGGTVQFHVNVPGATEWKWSFGDGTVVTSTDPVSGPNPSHTYTSIGLYSVTVEVKNCVDTTPRVSTPLAIDIVQLTPLVADFQAVAFCNNFGCGADAGKPITFNDLSSGNPDTWSYDWDNTAAVCGAGNSFEQANQTSPVTSHTYPSTGTFYPCLRLTRGAGTAYHLHAAINVAAAVPASISVSGPSSGSPGSNLVFSASASNCTPAASGWSWTTTSGSISGASNGSSISVSWATTGTKTVKATNSACGSASGSKSISISTTTTPPPSDNIKAAFSIVPTTGTVGQAVSFDASASSGSIASYSWDFGDGATGGGKNVNHTYAAAGSYTVTLTVGKTGCLSAGCFSSTTKSIVITSAGPGDPPPPPPGDVVAAFEVLPGAPNAGQSVTFDASTSTGDIASYSWDFGDGATGAGKVVAHTFDQPGTYPVSLSVGKTGCLSAGCFVTVSKQVVVGSGPAVGVNGCTGALAGDVDKLCLGEGRYIVEVDWENHHQVERPIGEGQSRRLGSSENTGLFWFFNPDSIDLIVKIIDGSVVNDHVWVFYGALTDVIYDLKVTDTASGKSKSYKNLAGSICGVGDTAAFSTVGLSAPASAGAAATAGDFSTATGEATQQEVLSLLDGRFRATVEWENHHAPALQTGTGRSVTGTNGTGYFWFFEPSSLDLVIKMIDAREFDGHFWVFYGGLSDVKYTLHIEDTESGQTWQAVNPKGSICGGSDTSAFSALGN
jgi:PKD repeat protein